MSAFRFLMLSAMYENGGNVTHRFLDGHPQLFVYPFESQLGTRYVQDMLSSIFPLKYRWPEFLVGASAYANYKAIIDEECKVRARTSHVSKFRHMPFEFSDDERCELFCEQLAKGEISRGACVEAFFRATFEAWKDYKRSGKEQVYVGYSPIVAVDGAKMLADLPGAHLLHIVRNPWSAYADTKKRPVPLSLSNYMLGWTLNQYYALQLKRAYPVRVHIVRTEDVMQDSVGALGGVLKELALETADSLKQPTWNGAELKEVYPWGTLRKVTPAANRATAAELSPEEIEQVSSYAWQYLDEFGYRDFLAT